MQEKIMTTDLAAALLRDVPRIWAYSYQVNEATSGAEPEEWKTYQTWETTDPYPLLGEEYVAVADVLAALSRALDPALAERVGEVLEALRFSCLVSAPGHSAATVSDLLTALLTANAALRAERDALAERLEKEMADCDAADRRGKRLSSRLTAAEAREERLRGALQEIATDEHPLGWIAIAALTETATTEADNG